jgi:hypothetical protein
VLQLMGLPAPGFGAYPDCGTLSGLALAPPFAV